MFIFIRTKYRLYAYKILGYMEFFAAVKDTFYIDITQRRDRAVSTLLLHIPEVSV
jgi:hypothetical protein